MTANKHQIILADSLFDALADLTKEERLRVIDFVNELRRSTKSTGMQMERVRRSKGLWSGRIDQDLRAILYRDGDTIAVLHAAHHDPAYQWAERRDVGRHPVTGAFQIVETVETVREVERQIAAPPKATPLLAAHDDPYLLSLGVPEHWLPALRKVTDADQLLGLSVHLPPDVADRLFRLADGEIVAPPAPIAPDRPLTEGTDSRRFFVLEDDDLLRAALDAPLDRWIAFLHPTQARLVTTTFAGPAKITGSAGTGKTVVAMHRARHLARQGKRVLLTTYVKTLCANLERNLRLLCSDDERAKITVSTVHAQALQLARRAHPRLQPAREDDALALIKDLAPIHAAGFDLDFIAAEWKSVVAPQGLTTWPEYRSAKRTGRGKPITVRERKALWNLFEALRARLLAGGKLDWPAICQRAAAALAEDGATSPFDAVLVDEVQDLSVPELRLLAAMTAKHPGDLVLFGDTGQRIYAGGFSLSALGIQVRGRSTVLKINYRTTEQIRRAADRLLGDTSDDMDEGAEGRGGTRSILRGPDPTFAGYPTPQAEQGAAVEHIRRWIASGLRPEAIAAFARTKKEVDALARALRSADLPVHVLGDDDAATPPAIAVGTMHRAKGLEFKSVLVVACTDKLLPFHLLVGNAVDPQDRDNALANERRLLYVAMTRARDELRVTWHRTPSPFLAPFAATAVETSA